MQKYISSSHVCLNVHLKNGANVHVSFSPLTGGGSVYYTADKDIQEGLKNHAKYGKLFNLDESFKETVKSAPKVKEPEPAQPRLKKIKVSCPEDAKDYLAETFGVSRTQMRSMNSIKSVALQKGIEFEGI